MEIFVPLIIVLTTSLVIAAGSRSTAAACIGAAYSLVGVLLWSEVSRQVALAYLATGLSSWAIIWLAGRKASAAVEATQGSAVDVLEPSERRPSSSAAPPLGWLFMSCTLVLCLIMAFGLSVTYPLSEATLASPWEGFVAYWLLITGLLAASVTRNPLRSGSGLLLFLCGASLTYILVSEGYRSFVVIGLLLIGILVSVAVSRLSVEMSGELRPEPVIPPSVASDQAR
ncbi:MAG: hypothetical protein HYX74_11075 [Acidobacteria bacterium]|nr:hypothetical protein [Acidobacteriota bacterium]